MDASDTVHDAFDYECKYPPDEEYKEMGPSARVWKTCVDEFTKYDHEMVANWRDGLDTLLVFAALFSSVVSTFLVQASQKLRVDYSQVVASLMSELIGVQRALGRGTSVDNVPETSASSRPDRSDLWLNGLWFTSLVLSLTIISIAALAKQWINEYTAPHETRRAFVSSDLSV
ncbi:hypothetical protein BDZ89DRAFT_1134946 [Hymenopellis radicata]|nr:hypothetical protein BDZ89DRAFT_1134946 [Hymenopellis radicata]